MLLIKADTLWHYREPIAKVEKTGRASPKLVRVINYEQSNNEAKHRRLEDYFKAAAYREIASEPWQRIIHKRIALIDMLQPKELVDGVGFRSNTQLIHGVPLTLYYVDVAECDISSLGMTDEIKTSELAWILLRPRRY